VIELSKEEYERYKEKLENQKIVLNLSIAEYQQFLREKYNKSEVIKYLENLHSKAMSFYAFIFGRGQSGKSSLALNLYFYFSKNHDFENFVFFDWKDFIKRYKYIQNSIILLEELEFWFRKNLNSANLEANLLNVFDASPYLKNSFIATAIRLTDISPSFKKHFDILFKSVRRGVFKVYKYVENINSGLMRFRQIREVIYSYPLTKEIYLKYSEIEREKEKLISDALKEIQNIIYYYTMMNEMNLNNDNLNI
jgi:hypothetical protein